MITTLKKRAYELEREACALVIAARDPRVPWYAKAFMGLVLAHTFSPIDLIPDFIPVLGYLDDLVVTPLGIALALKMIPADVIVDARQQADRAWQQGRPVSRAGAIIVIAFWLVVVILVAWWVRRLVGR